MKYVLVIAAVAASTTLLAPTVASAQESDELSTSVSHRDLNLSIAKGHERLQKRVASAVREMCADNAVRGAARQSEVRACVAAANTAAEQQVRQAMADRQVKLAARQ